MSEPGVASPFSSNGRAEVVTPCLGLHTPIDRWVGCGRAAASVIPRVSETEPMTLDTLTAAADWDPSEDPEVVEALSSLGPEDRVLVWCDDGCKDCQALLPAFAAALEAAAVPSERVVQHAVERLPGGRKRGPMVDAYDIRRIPTVVVERDGVELARYVEGNGEAIADSIAEQLAAVDTAG